MKRLDLTLTPALNLALDDALIENAESANSGEELSKASTSVEGGIHHGAEEVLRFWEPESPIVVIGRSSPLAMEVNQAYCNANRIPVFRRISGGQSIVTGPGCLMYAVLLDYRKRPELRMLDQAHSFVMHRMQAALGSIGVATEMEGTCDLTLSGRKFSGNALRCRRNWLLYHGTILCDGFDLSLIGKCLGPPKRRPDYRGDRSHDEFVTTIPVETSAVRTAITRQWSASEELEFVPTDLADKLAREKYSSAQWLNKVP